MIRCRRILGAVCLAALLAAAAPARAQGPPVSLVLNLPSLTLAVYVNGSLDAVYPTAAGRPGHPTPRGTFRIVSKILDPWWLPPDGGAAVPPGPANPLGRWWLGLNLPGYGLHGTNDESSIGGWVSRGCVRLRNQDAERLFGLTQVGVPVSITYHTAVVQANGWRWAHGETGLTFLERTENGAFRLSIYPDVYRLAAVSAGVLAALLEAAGADPGLSAEDLAWLATRAAEGPVDLDPAAVLSFNAWELGRGCLTTAAGAWLPWDVVAPALALARDAPPADAVTLAGRTWVTVDGLRREAGLPLGFKRGAGSADLSGVAVLLEDRFLTGAAFLRDGTAYVLASELCPGQERVFVPVRPTAALLGLGVHWDSERQSVLLTAR